MEDRTLACTVCGIDFTFTADEQEFYASKGFQEPKKCKPCRQEAKRSRGGGGGYGGGGYNQGPRRFFDAVCAGCGVETQVPFEPKGSRPVYCRDCYQYSRSG